MNTLVIDVGGTHVKVCAHDVPEMVKFDSSPTLTPDELMAEIKEHTQGWKYERVSLGVPARVGPEGIIDEPGNLGKGWKKFDFRKAFGKPTRLINDAAMQALGAYKGGRMLFLGFGTGLGSTLITEGVVIPLELGDLLFDDEKLSVRIAGDAHERMGVKPWRKEVIKLALMLQGAFCADDVVLGGGKAGRGLLDPLEKPLRAGGNEDAFVGGFRLWEETVEPLDQKPREAFRLVL